eukprot:1179365-Prorocentrum_minimum.AAC.3
MHGLKGHTRVHIQGVFRVQGGGNSASQRLREATQGWRRFAQVPRVEVTLAQWRGQAARPLRFRIDATPRRHSARVTFKHLQGLMFMFERVQGGAIQDRAPAAGASSSSWGVRESAPPPLGRVCKGGVGGMPARRRGGWHAGAAAAAAAQGEQARRPWRRAELHGLHRHRPQ